MLVEEQRKERSEANGFSFRMFLSREFLLRGRFISGVRTRFFVTRPRTERIVHLCSLVVSRVTRRFYLAKQRHFGRAREEAAAADTGPLPSSFSRSLFDSTSGPMFSARYIVGGEPESHHPPTLVAPLVVATRVPACAGKNAGPSR